MCTDVTNLTKTKQKHEGHLKQLRIVKKSYVVDLTNNSYMQAMNIDESGGFYGYCIVCTSSISSSSSFNKCIPLSSVLSH